MEHPQPPSGLALQWRKKLPYLGLAGLLWRFPRNGFFPLKISQKWFLSFVILSSSCDGAVGWSVRFLLFSAVTVWHLCLGTRHPYKMAAPGCLSGLPLHHFVHSGEMLMLIWGVGRCLSDICFWRLPLGLNPGRAGNFPRAGSDGSLLATASSITIWVLGATAGTAEILFVHFLGWRCFLLVCLGFWAILISPFILFVAFCGPGVLVSSLWPAGCVLLRQPPVLPFPVGRAWLLTGRSPRALGLHCVLWRPRRVRFLLGGLPQVRGVMVSLSLCLLVHILRGSAIALLCFPWAGRAPRQLRPVFRGFLGTGGFGVAPARLSGVGAGAGALMGLLRVLLSSCPDMLLCQCSTARPQEIAGGGHFGWRRGHFRGREVNRGWRRCRRLPVRRWESGKVWGWNGYFVLWT